MLRRSSRLKSKYPSPDEDSTITSSTGSPTQISYRESPVRIFKKKSRTHRLTNDMGLESAVHSSSQKTKVTMSPPSSTVTPIIPSPSSLMEKQKLFLKISLEEGYNNTRRPNARSRSGLLKLYWWLGPAWYSLIAGISWINVSLLSSTVVMRKTILLIILLLLLVFGLFYWYPYFTDPDLFTDTQASIQLPLNDNASSATLLTLKEEINADLYRHQARWTESMENLMIEIRMLKEEGQKQKITHEMLEMDLKALRVRLGSVHSEHKVMVKELSGIHHQLSDLRSEVSLLRSSSEHFSHRLDTQETQNLRLKKELSDWLLQHVPWLDSSGQDVVMQPELQMALETLEKNIMDKLDKDREKDVGSTVGETLQEEEVRALTIKDVKQIVHRALSVFRADGTGMADYALESSGACVINSRCSESYHGQIACFSIFGIPLFYYTNSPRTVIQPELYPGKCWAFRGSEGFLTISLSSPVKITHVTLEHLPRVLSPTGHINSAPKDFAVYGMTDENEGGKLLGRFTYDQEGEPIQTFKIPVSANEVYWLVELRILSNWGNPEYTCIYRFRVHGQPWTS
uniref:Si:dkey-92f12.2 n=1 Tax=Astyanax mexicanus TaxID=7994 RepID=A0A8B9JJC0_ASTMX